MPIPDGTAKPPPLFLGKKVVIVEDTDRIRQILRMALERQGFQVIAANDGRAGYGAVQRERPDLILLDIMMPQMSGLEMLRLMKMDKTLKHIPVVIVSAKAQQADIDRALSLGAAAYIVKPFPLQKILDTITQVLGQGPNPTPNLTIG